jgi:phenylacetate-CoA ligase
MCTTPLEYKPLSEIYSIQERLLRKQLDYIGKNSKYYSNVFKKEKIDTSKIKTLKDLTVLPPTTKDDLQKYNSDFICVGKEKIIDYVTTSGTLGEPVIFALTNKDLDRLAYNEALSLSCADCSEKDIFQITTTLDRRFMAGLAYFMGARKMGAGIVRVGNGVPEFQWDTINRIKPTALIAVPSFLIKLIEYAESENIDYNNSSIKKAICIGDPLRKIDFSMNILGKRISNKWNIQLYSTYASTEMSAAFTECMYKNGGHSHPELILVEFLDDNNNPVTDGEAGEVTITTLGVEGMPLLRFKTGDMCYSYSEPCHCGRTTMRLGPIIGRKQQMIKFHGTTLYPSILFDFLDRYENITCYYIEISSNNIGLDDITVHLSVREYSDGFDNALKEHFRAKLRVVPSICFEEESRILEIVNPEEARKTVKIIDRRK